MKKSLVYEVLSDMMTITPDGLMEIRIQDVVFTKKIKMVTTSSIRHGSSHTLT